MSAAPAKAAPRKAAKKAPAKKAAPRKAAKKAPAPPPPPPEPPVDPYDRARKVHQGLVAGGNWEKLAEEFEYPDVATAAMEVRAYLTFVHVMTGDEERQVAKRIQLEQYNTLLQEWWPSATAMKDKDAAAVVLKVMDQQAKLQELYDMSQRAGSTQTIVITGAGDMAAQLRAMAEAQIARDAHARAAIGPGQPQDVVDAEVVSPTPENAPA